MVCVVADAILVPEEPPNTGRKALTESEVRIPKTHSTRALMAQTMHLASLPSGLLPHSAQLPKGSISFQPGAVSTCPKSLSGLGAPWGLPRLPTRQAETGLTAQAIETSYITMSTLCFATDCPFGGKFTYLFSNKRMQNVLGFFYVFIYF